MRGNINCHCGCGMTLKPETLDILHEIERRAGFDLYITSGARCASYNGQKGFSLNSAHTLGLAADISTPTAQNRFAILAAFFKLGLKRGGYKTSDSSGARFIHIDLAAGLPVPFPRSGLTHYPTDVFWDY